MSRREEEDRAFIQSIRESPEDDAPRLIYADWLEDHGDEPRAEFIRVQCELARLDPDHERQTALQKRQQELLSAHRANWLGPIEDSLSAHDHCAFRWGFPFELTIRPRSMVKVAEEIDRRVPAARVRPYGTFGDPALKAITKSPHMGWLTGLEWRYTGLAESGLVVLGEAENLPRCRPS